MFCSPEDHWLWFRPECMKCDQTADCEVKCGPLCEACLRQYRAEYVEYKSTADVDRQIKLRQRFAEKWFMGELDAEHEWSLKELAATRRPPPFTFDARRMRGAPVTCGGRDRTRPVATGSGRW